MGHKPAHTLRYKWETMDKTGVICKIKCYECNKEYIEETRKELRKRITEHKNALQRSTNTSEQRITVLTGMGQQF